MSKGEWIDVAEGNLWDTNKDDKPLQWSDGTKYHAGMLTLNLHGALVKLYCQVSKGERKGSIRLRMSMPVDTQVSTKTTAAKQPTAAK